MISAEAYPHSPDIILDRTTTIAEIVAQAEAASGYTVKEIPVWGAGVVAVQPGEVGMITTEGLNGCHTTILAGKNTEGEGIVTMTHFPPSIGSERYVTEVRSHRDQLEAHGVTLDTIFTFSDEKRFPREAELLESEFRGSATLYETTYSRLDADRQASPDKGQCLAILDNRVGEAQLIVATDTGNYQIPIIAVN